MKQLLLVTASLCLFTMAMAQKDSTVQNKDTTTRRDTIRIAGRVLVTIVKKTGKSKSDSSTTVEYSVGPKKTANISTNWFILDLGFNNYTDNTNYASAEAQAFSPGATKDRFKLRTGKSVNVNLWLFMQRVNMIQHVVNLNYGLGLEINNYRYKEDIVFNKNPTSITASSIDYSKNKLAITYITVPLMLDFNFTPNKTSANSFGLSLGVSGGYRYSSHQKVKSSGDGKRKTRDDFDLLSYKLAYVAELKLGPVRLYGSKATQSMFDKGLDQVPYSVGIRFAKW
ncbi:MAG: outer membrane beta-barrel protein [Chitinophagaceae bacterium]